MAPLKVSFFKDLLIVCLLAVSRFRRSRVFRGRPASFRRGIETEKFDRIRLPV